MVLGVEGPPKDCCQQHKKSTRGEDGAVDSPGEACYAGFPDTNLAVLNHRRSLDPCCPGMVVILFGVALVLILSIPS